MPLRGVSQMLKTITSRDNKVIKNIRAAEKKKGRSKTGLYLAEGKRLVGEAIRDIFDSVESVLASESFLEKNNNDVMLLLHFCRQVNLKQWLKAYIIHIHIFGRVGLGGYFLIKFDHRPKIK